MDKTNTGLIHIYFCDGKGKTTAAVGLTVRAAGCGKRVVFAQFLKGMKTGETASLEKLGIPVIRSDEFTKFSWEMTEKEKEECRAVQSGLLDRISAEIRNAGNVDLVILDEALGAISTGLLDEEKLKDFIQNRPDNIEVVITGRTVPEWLTEEADYITEMKKHKHPFDKGVGAREGIEQ